MTEPVTHAELEELLERAVEQGVKKVLHDMGVPDTEEERIAFRRDLSEMRGLLMAFRDARSVIWRTFVKWLTVAVLTAIALGSGWGFLHDKLK